MKKDDIKLDKNFLYDCLLKLETREEIAAFMEDLCTVQELNSITQRLWVAVLLKQNKTYTAIAASTGSSTATISRVNRSLSYGTGGYDRLFEKLGDLKENYRNE